MSETRFKDRDWDLGNGQGQTTDWERVSIAVLMDIRDELKKLNQLLHCSNFVAIPRKLDKIELNARKRKNKK